MIRAFWLVLLDLWHFVFGVSEAVPRTSVETRSLPPAPSRTFLEAKPKMPSLLAPSQLLPLSVPASTSDVPLATTHSLADPLHMYVSDLAGARLLISPRMDFDGAVAIIPYAQVVTVRAFFGAYALVATNFGEGYLHKDSLTPNQAEVWPSFRSGETYDATSTVAIQTRLLTKDDFMAGALALPLQAGEYITLRLLRDRHSISWPQIRPRTIGEWHHILRGRPQVRISVNPATDTIMEWTADDNIGRLAYIEAVLPDQTLRVSGVGIMVAGEYSELTFKESVWREWRPVFIFVVS